MSRRIEIELTSQKDDTTWTWRAAGAKLPKGTLDTKVLYAGAKVGAIVKAEADFGLDGIEILTVTAPASAPPPAANVIEVIGSGKNNEGGVTTQLAPKRGGKGGDKRGRDDKKRGTDKRGERKERAPRTERSPGRPRPEAKPKAKRLIADSKHRDAVLAELAPEVRAIAEQVLRGGVPAVRQSLDEQNKTAKAEGRPQTDMAPLVTLAEELLPRLKAAEWMDRAEAAVKDEALAMRDLRSLMATASSLAKTDESRALATTLRETLDARTEAERTAWSTNIAAAIDDGRLVHALRLSSRPPDVTTKFDADLAARLVDATNTALEPSSTAERWLTLIEAAATSSVRRTIVPTGLPTDNVEKVKTEAAQFVGKIPALGKLLGLRMPPPPRKRPPAPVGATATTDD